MLGLQDIPSCQVSVYRLLCCIVYCCLRAELFVFSCVMHQLYIVSSVEFVGASVSESTLILPSRHKISTDATREGWAACAGAR